LYDGSGRPGDGCDQSRAAQIEEHTEKAQVRVCYEVIYYPAKSLLGESSCADSYEAIAAITRIAVADAEACLE